MNASRTRLTFVSLIVLAVVVFSLAYWPPEKGATTPTTTFSATYDEPSETLTIVVEGDEVLTGEKVEHIRVLRYDDDTSKFVDDGVRLQAGGDRWNGSVWASTTEDGVATFPIERGDEVRVYEVGTDRDDDGRAGVEPGDEVLVQIEFDQINATIARFAISRDGTVIDFREDNTTDIPRTEQPIRYGLR